MKNSGPSFVFLHSYLDGLGSIIILWIPILIIIRSFCGLSSLLIADADGLIDGLVAEHVSEDVEEEMIPIFGSGQVSGEGASQLAADAEFLGLNKAGDDDAHGKINVVVADVGRRCIWAWALDIRKIAST